MSDGYAAKYRRVGVDDHIVLNDRMARNVDGIAVLIKLEALGTKRNSLIELNMIANNCSFAYNYAGTVVYAKKFADTGSRVNVDTGKRVSKFSYNAGQDGHTKFKQAVSHTVMIHGHKRWITQDYLLMAYGSGVTVKDCLDIGTQQTAQFGDALNELLCHILGTARQGLVEYAAYISYLV